VVTGDETSVPLDQFFDAGHGIRPVPDHIPQTQEGIGPGVGLVIEDSGQGLKVAVDVGE
jgi:hypothetical protein